MNTITLTVPALLFSAISLLLLAYTNRFLVLSNLIRDLHSKMKDREQCIITRQIKNLRKRVVVIRLMQILGVLSFLFCTISMFLIFIKQQKLAEMSLGLSLISLISSLFFSLYEIIISTQALHIELEDME